MATIRIGVHVSGPLFDDDTHKIMSEFVTEAVQEVGAQGLANWHTHLDASLKHPTGWYEEHLTSELMAPDVDIMHDKGMIYGPWLEGTGSRNQTTKFKGYAAARLAAQELEAQADQVLQPAVQRLIARLGGE